ncbi:MAG: amidohydrolase family protein [Spirochaetaceae bacterium]|nr:MAG: amidohydrolase family protein [Spirochaetaceae bacterium]
MIVDAHNHVNWLGYTPERIIENMDQNRIDRTWLLSWEAPENEIDPAMYTPKFYPGKRDLPCSDVFAAAARFPDRFVAGYCPDPRIPGAVDRLELAVEQYGVQVCGELKLRMMFDNLDALRLYNVCGKLKIPVVVHIDYEIPLGTGNYPRSNYWYGGGIEPFERALRNCPETVFIGHGPGFWGHISKDQKCLKTYYPEGPVIPGGELYRLLREYPNLYADLSADSARNGLSREPRVGKEFLLEFQDRLLFARDCFTGSLMELLESFSLPPEVMERILSGNARALLARRSDEHERKDQG